MAATVGHTNTGLPSSTGNVPRSVIPTPNTTYSDHHTSVTSVSCPHSADPRIRPQQGNYQDNLVNSYGMGAIPMWTQQLTATSGKPQSFSYLNSTQALIYPSAHYTGTQTQDQVGSTSSGSTQFIQTRAPTQLYSNTVASRPSWVNGTTNNAITQPQAQTNYGTKIIGSNPVVWGNTSIGQQQTTLDHQRFVAAETKSAYITSSGVSGHYTSAMKQHITVPAANRSLGSLSTHLTTGTIFTPTEGQQLSQLRALVKMLIDALGVDVKNSDRTSSINTEVSPPQEIARLLVNKRVLSDQQLREVEKIHSTSFTGVGSSSDTTSQRSFLQRFRPGSLPPGVTTALQVSEYLTSDRFLRYLEHQIISHLKTGGFSTQTIMEWVRRDNQSADQVQLIQYLLEGTQYQSSQRILDAGFYRNLVGLSGLQGSPPIGEITNAIKLRFEQLEVQARNGRINLHTGTGSVTLSSRQVHRLENLLEEKLSDQDFEGFISRSQARIQKLQLDLMSLRQLNNEAEVKRLTYTPELTSKGQQLLAAGSTSKELIRATGASIDITSGRTALSQQEIQLVRTSIDWLRQQPVSAIIDTSRITDNWVQYLQKTKQLSLDLQQANTQVSTLTAEIKSATSRSSQLENRLANLRRGLIAEFSSGFGVRLTLAEDQLSQEDSSKLRKVAGDYQAGLRAGEAANSAAAEVQKLRRVTQEYERNISSLREQSEQELAELRAEYASSEKGWKDQICQLKKFSTEQEVDILKTAHALRKAQKAISSLVGQHNQLVTKLAHSECWIKQAVAHYQANVSELKSQNLNLRQELNSTVANTKNVQETLSRDYEEKTRTLRQQLDLLSSTPEKLKRVKQQEVEVAQKLLAADKSKSDNDVLRKQLEDWRNQLNRFHAKVQAQEVEVQQKEAAALAQFQHLESELQQRETQVNSEHQEIKVLRTEVHQREAQLNLQAQQLQNEQARITQEGATWEREKKHILQSQAELARRTTNLQLETDQLKQRLRESESQKTQVLKKYMAFLAIGNLMKEACQAEFQKLKSENDALRIRASELDSIIGQFDNSVSENVKAKHELVVKPTLEDEKAGLQRELQTLPEAIQQIQAIQPAPGQKVVNCIIQATGGEQEEQDTLSPENLEELRSQLTPLSEENENLRNTLAAIENDKLLMAKAHLEIDEKMRRGEPIVLDNIGESEDAQQKGAEEEEMQERPAELILPENTELIETLKQHSNDIKEEQGEYVKGVYQDDGEPVKQEGTKEGPREEARMEEQTGQQHMVIDMDSLKALCNELDGEYDKLAQTLKETEYQVSKAPDSECLSERTA